MKYMVISLLVASLCACAMQPTRYVRADGAGHYGYRDSQLGVNRYRVTFAGNAATSQDKVKDYALKRAAELTLKNGYDWFKVLSSNVDHESTHSPSESIAMNTPPEVTHDCGLLGCTTSVAPGYTGVAVTTDRVSNRYASSIEIVMGKGKAKDPTSVYNAGELLKFLDKKY